MLRKITSGSDKNRSKNDWVMLYLHNNNNNNDNNNTLEKS